MPDNNYAIYLGLTFGYPFAYELFQLMRMGPLEYM